MSKYRLTWRHDYKGSKVRCNLYLYDMDFAADFVKILEYGLVKSEEDEGFMPENRRHENRKFIEKIKKELCPTYQNTMFDVGRHGFGCKCDV